MDIKNKQSSISEFRLDWKTKVAVCGLWSGRTVSARRGSKVGLRTLFSSVTTLTPRPALCHSTPLRWTFNIWNWFPSMVTIQGDLLYYDNK